MVSNEAEKVGAIAPADFEIIIILKNVRTLVTQSGQHPSNQVLYSRIFGVDLDFAAKQCRILGIDPKAKETSYVQMVKIHKGVIENGLSKVRAKPRQTARNFQKSNGVLS